MEIRKLKVQSRPCDQCLFGKNKIVDEEVKEQVILECQNQDTHFICHKGSYENQNIVCKGFFDRELSTNVQLAKRLNFFELVEVK